MKKVHFFVAASSLLTILSSAYGLLIKDIKVTGNQRIPAESILSFGDVSQGQHLSFDDENRLTRAIYDSGYFSKVNVSSQGNSLKIHVEEHPIVNEVQIEGNSEIDDEKLKPEIELASRQVFTKAKLKKDIDQIKKLYRLKGHFSAHVTPKIIKRDQNRVDVIFVVNEGKPTLVRKIFFVGNQSFDHGKLEEKIRTKEARWYRFFTNDDNYDPNRVAYDGELLREFYLEHGYADFVLKSAVAELSPDQEDFFLTFTIHEGPRYKMGKIKVEAKFPKVDMKKLESVLALREGYWYNSKLIEQTIENLTLQLGSMGYAFVDAQLKSVKDKEKGIIDVVFELREGPKVYIDQIHIVGNNRTNDETIRREMAIAEGDAFNSHRLKMSENNIKDLGFFKDVKIERKPGKSPDRMDLIVKVDEDKTGEISLSGGYSSDVKFTAEIGFKESNFRGKGQELATRFRLSRASKEFDISFMEPRFLDRDLAFTFNIFHISQNKFQNQNYSEKTSGFTTGIAYNLAPFWVQRWSYSLKQKKADYVDAEKRDDVLLLVYKREGAEGSNAGVAPNPNPAINSGYEGIYPLRSPFADKDNKKVIESSISHDIGFDGRNSRMNPSQGYNFGLATSFNGVGGDIGYLSNTFYGGIYFTLASEVVLSVNGSYTVVTNTNNKFRLMDNLTLSLRGFEPGGIGPIDYKTDQSMGGRKSYTVIAEVTYPIGLPRDFNMRGAAFVDAGSLWDVGTLKWWGSDVNTGEKVTKADLKDAIKSDNHILRSSWGFGLRWRSPMGPLKIDFGFPIKKAPTDKRQVVAFGLSTRF